MLRRNTVVAERDVPRQKARVSPRERNFTRFAEVPGLRCHLRGEESEQNGFSFVTRRFSLDQPEHCSGNWNRRK